MKRTHLIAFLLLLAAAGVIGWFLPVLAAAGSDRSLEGKTEPVSVRQVDLSYQSDLNVEDRLRLMREQYSEADSIPLQRGIVMTEQNVLTVMERFLQDLAGDSLSLDSRACVVEPELLRFGTNGSFLVWNVTLWLSDAWRFDAVLDDQTGLMLRGIFSGSPDDWAYLYEEIGMSPDEGSFFVSVLGEALRRHFSSQLSANYKMETEIKTISLGLQGNYRFIAGKNDQHLIPIWFVVPQGCIIINQR